MGVRPVPSGADISEKVSAHTDISFLPIPLPTSLLSHPEPRPPHSESTEMLSFLPFPPPSIYTVSLCPLLRAV